MALDNRGADLASPLPLPELIRLLTGLVPDVMVLNGHGCSDGAQVPMIARVAVDSRGVKAGTVFVALKGERTDGHAFIEGLAREGLLLAIAGREWSGANDAEVRSIRQYGCTLLLADDPLTVLQGWAAWWLRSNPHVLRVGVTGSSGKTTVKDMITAMVGQVRRTWSSQGNLNSVIGSPLALLAMPASTEVGVFEMAMSERGEMAALADMIRPDVAMITNIGTAHLQNLGSRQGIAAEKKAITAYFDGTQTLVVPRDDDFASFLAEGVKGAVEYFGDNSDLDWEPDGRGGQVLRMGGHEVALPAAGRHIRMDALGALKVAELIGMSSTDALKGLAHYSPAFGRGQILRGRCTAYVDCYNANPDSMDASLEAFGELGILGRKVLILGDMLELGPDQKSAHEALGPAIVSTGAALVLLFGEAMAAVLPAVRHAGSTAELRHFSDFPSLLDACRVLVQAGDLVLLKGSRGMALERLLPVLDPDFILTEARHV